ncbi:MAG TPA: hypothetical protein VJA94_07480, partial [Candidatus Angelobacter sp.]
VAGLPSADRLSILGMFDGITVGKLAHLADLAGGSDLVEHLPADVQKGLQTLNKLSLEALTIQLGKGFAVNGIGIAVGLPSINTTVLPGFALQKLLANFSISQPFAADRSLSVTLEAGVEFLGAPFDMALTLPEVAGVARLTGNATLPLNAVFNKLSLPAPPDLTINEMQFAASKNGSFSFAARMAEKPSWTLDLGPVPVVVSDVTVLASQAQGAPASGSFSGQVSLGSELDLAFAYQTPGDFILRADLPEVRLSQLISKLSNQPVKLPGSFDLDFTDSTVLIRKSGSGLVFLFATTMKDLGTVAFEARRTSTAQNTWGFAAGVDLNNIHLSTLPGLGALKPFEDFFTLHELMIVVSSFEDPGFVFPSLAEFNSPIIRAGNLKLPAQAGGIVPGFNAYARWTLDTSKREHKMLQKFLGLDPSLGITLQVGFDPSKESRLYVSYSTTIQGLPFDCKFGGQISSGQVGLFLTGTLKAKIQGHLTQFDVTALFVPTGMFISGDMVGSITFEGITLSNLAIVIGVDWEGIPSLGVAATLTVSHFQSSLAVFFDSTEPSRSMLAGSLSDLSLKDVVDTFAGKVVPSSVDPVLGEVALVGTSEFTIPADVAAALDKMQIDVVSAAFSKAGASIPSIASQVLLVAGKPGQSWFITNMANLFHYELVRMGNSIRVRLNPQFFLVPQTTFLGALQFNQGTFINTAIQVLSFHAMVKILVMPSQGVSVDGAMSRVVIGTEALFSIESADGKQGPRVSAATFNQPSMKDATLRGPHFLIDGRLNLLGLTLQTYVNLTSKGFIFAIKDTPWAGLSYDMRGHFNGPSNMGAGGSVIVGVKQGMVDFGRLGKVNLNADVNGNLDVGVEGRKIWARFGGGFEFGGEHLSLPTLDLDVTTKALVTLPGKVAELAEIAIKAALDDASRWARWIGDKTVTGVTDMGNELKTFFGVTSPKMAAQLMKTAKQDTTVIANTLSKTYQQGADGIASAMQYAGYGVDEVGNALRGIGVTSAIAIASALKSAGYTVNEVGGYIKDAFHTGPAELKNLLEQAHFPTNQIQGYFNSLGGDFKKAFDTVGDTAKKGVDTVSDTAKKAAGAAAGAGKKAADTVADTAKKAGSQISDTGSKIGKGIKKLFGR